MIERTLGRTDLKINAVGFGGIPIQKVSDEEAVRVVRRCYELGINYYDTARGYTVSEERVGKALKDVRNEVVIATKTHALTKDTALADLETSLKKLQTDHVDIYQLHGVSSEEAWEKISGQGGALEALYQAMAKGKTNHIGITSHNIRLLDRIIEENIFETVLIQYNYLSRQPAEDFLQKCRARNIGSIIMKPFGGGAFSNAATALKFVLANNDVNVVIPGMATVSEVEENLAVTSGSLALTEEELQLIERDGMELGDQFCRGCDYCQPCPQEVPISSVLRAESVVKRMGRIPRVETSLRERMEESTRCVECGTCESRCPYQLPIRELLKAKRKYIASVLGG